MNAPELQSKLRNQPFVPLRLHLTDGSTFDIRHPENAIVSIHTIYVVTHADPQTGVAESVEWLSLRHIVRVEQLATAGTSAEN
jgi:hypothetical protein